EETRELLRASGVALSDRGVALLRARTEGWAAGLRLAALSLARHPDPERFVAEFAGSERTVAEYLLAEVLERQPDDVRRLLLRTSVLDRVNGELADRLVGGSGSDRVLNALADANAFVAPLDASRAWFPSPPLFADLLRLELRRTDPAAIPELHGTAAGWYAERGYILDAVRHAQAARDWRQAARLLADHHVSLLLNGQAATVNGLLAAFPPDVAADPELAVVFAFDRVTRASLDDGAAYVALAERRASSVPDDRRQRIEAGWATARLSLARRCGDFGAVLDEVRPLLALAEPRDPSDVVLGSDLRALALMNLGIVERWSLRAVEA